MDFQEKTLAVDDELKAEMLVAEDEIERFELSEQSEIDKILKEAGACSLGRSTVVQFV